MAYKLRWSEESIRTLDEIIDDIRRKWTELEVNNFKLKLSHQLNLIKQNPLMFPASSRHPSLRKAVLSKQTTVFYVIQDETVFLAYIHLNRKDDGSLK
ncbi:type II toxin-antitoxin system RelE/ParE family toxin [Candidatus Peregrinibacteria bacterium]|nr:type II toxin-antitoxin system RelE/ParE family toxin [Candidatus Peregrinibacteria bacterium]